jgi:hypothetical protein
MTLVGFSWGGDQTGLQEVDFRSAIHLPLHELNLSISASV